VKVFRTETLTDNGYTEIVSLLNSGGVIGFPTDTAYGLGADPFNEAALERIFEIKGRPEFKPVLLLVDSVAMAKSLTRAVPAVFYAVVEKFWPGPLTIIVPSHKALSPKLTAGTNTVGIRFPVAPFASELIRHFKKPLTATSANRSGAPSTVTADDVRSQLGTNIDALVDGGLLPARGGSTLLDLTNDPPVMLREGPITFESLAEFFQGRIRRHVA
jgi:L-threonylcarbamoyladenylate synthase